MSRNRRLSSELVYSGGIINLRIDEVELPGGRRAKREIIEHPGAAAIVPVDGEGNIHLVRQYRDAVSDELIEIPAGKLKPGEQPEACARRELEEELSLLAGDMTHLATFYSTPGFCDEVMHIFLARDLKQSPAATPDELVDPVTMPFLPVEALVARLRDAKSIAGVLLASKKLGDVP